MDADINSNAAIANDKLAAPSSFFTIALTSPPLTDLTATADPFLTYQMPFAATLVEVSATAITIDTGSGNETYTIGVEENGATVLSSAIAITVANTPVVGSVSDTSIADNAKIEVILTTGGTTPAISGITVLFTFKVDHTN